VRVGIVSGQPQAVQTLRRAMAFGRAQVIWVATSGTEAVDLCAKDAPDVVLMDLVIGQTGASVSLDGIDATRRVMSRTPCPILIVTENVDANPSRVFDAMRRGAIDAVDMPVWHGASLKNAAGPLLRKMEIIARLGGPPQTQRSPGLEDGLIAIGASAGGPGALATLLGSLPPDFPIPIVIVQHLDEQFVVGMTAWLSQQSSLPVRLAEEGDRPAASTVLLAGSCNHLVLKGDRLGYHAEPRDSVYRPSIDVFFQSLGRLWPGDVVGILLTGMGRDGAVGLKALRNEGHHTIAQDEATSSVYGMPRAAAIINAAVDILPIDRIAQRLTGLALHPR
jgi:two-component system response regulator WspF